MGLPWKKRSRGDQAAEIKRMLAQEALHRTHMKIRPLVEQARYGWLIENLGGVLEIEWYDSDHGWKYFCTSFCEEEAFGISKREGPLRNLHTLNRLLDELQ